MSRVSRSASMLMAFAAIVALPAAAEAGCTPSLSGDSLNNICIGYAALGANTTGYVNTAIGLSALRANTTGRYNTANGAIALYSNTTGVRNAAIGTQALYSNTVGSENSATGNDALLYNQTGNNNTATGNSALALNQTGNNNTANGNLAGAKGTGSNNTMIGAEAGFAGDLFSVVRMTGSNNIALGYQAGSQWTTGSNNIAIGNQGVAAEAGTIRIGSNQTRTFMAGITVAKIAKGQAVMVDANGQLGTKKSSIRFKEDVHDMGQASAPLMQLRPVTFRYKDAEADGSKPLQYGLIAEEVEKVMPDLVVYNEKGTPESVAYDELPSLMLNEYQKQARELAETKARLAAAEAKSDAMEAELATLKLAVSRLADRGAGTSLAANAP